MLKCTLAFDVLGSESAFSMPQKRSGNKDYASRTAVADKVEMTAQPRGGGKGKKERKEKKKESGGSRVAAVEIRGVRWASLSSTGPAAFSTSICSTDYGGPGGGSWLARIEKGREWIVKEVQEDVSRRHESS